MPVREVTDAEVADYQEKGWVHLKGLIDRETIQRLHDRAQDLERAQQHYKDFGEMLDRCFRAFPGEEQNSPLMSFMFTPAMGRNCARLMDVPQARALSTGSYLLKMPEATSGQVGTTYHQDFLGNPMDRNFFTMWIALHDLPAESGTMQFYDGSHRRGVLGQAYVDALDFRDRYKLSGAELSPPYEMGAGDVTVHHSLCLHGTPPNRTDQNRWGMAVIFFDADSRFNGITNIYTDGLALQLNAPLDHPKFPLIPTQ
jgi:hypothetical protein